MLLLLLRTLLLYAVLLVGERLMGKRQIGQLQTSELVSTLLLSELAVLPIQNGGDPLWRGLLPMGALILCEVGVSLWMLKSGRFRQLVCGRPMVVVAHGKILQDQMRRLRMTTEDLLEQLRQSGSFYLEEVDWAIVETNGTLSVLRRPDRDPLTPEQAGGGGAPPGAGGGPGQRRGGERPLPGAAGAGPGLAGGEAAESRGGPVPGVPVHRPQRRQLPAGEKREKRLTPSLSLVY